MIESLQVPELARCPRHGWTTEFCLRRGAWRCGVWGAAGECGEEVDRVAREHYVHLSCHDPRGQPAWLSELLAKMRP